MRKIFLALALLATAPVISGCTQLAAATKNEQVATYDEKALIVLESSFDLALDTIIRAGNEGLINQSQAQRLLPLLMFANEKVEDARALYDSGQRFESGPIFVALAALMDALRAERLL